MFTSKYRHVTKGIAIITALGRVTWERDDKSVRQHVYAVVLSLLLPTLNWNTFAHNTFPRLIPRFIRKFLHQSPVLLGCTFQKLFLKIKQIIFKTFCFIDAQEVCCTLVDYFHIGSFAAYGSWCAASLHEHPMEMGEKPVCAASCVTAQGKSAPGRNYFVLNDRISPVCPQTTLSCIKISNYCFVQLKEWEKST